MNIAAQETRGEEPQHSLEIGHRRARLDKQPLHLMKHRVMGGVSSVGAVNAAERHNPQRRLALLHDADLHGACLRPEQERIGPLGDGKIKIVERIAGRVLGTDRQGLEVVPLVFDLGAIDTLEAEPGHDLLDPPDRLRDWMDVAMPEGEARERDVDRRSLGGGPCEPRLGGIEGGRDRSLRLVKKPARFRAIGPIETAEKLLDALQSPTLGPSKLDSGLLELRVIAGNHKRRNRLGAETLDVGAERFKRHGAHATNRPLQATPAGAAMPRASRTCSAMTSKLVGSRIAISESVFRSSSQPIFSRPAMNWL